jgi:3-isopropylmalate/(R)-2-methylmalate dehydratase small subunit
MSAAAGTSVIASVSGRALPLRGDDIDTDRIIPARFLRCVTFEGIEAHAFEDDRKGIAAAGGAAHPFDDSRYAGAAVLIVNRNFGCGSSREHAPQALRRWGIRGVVGESFAEIFFGNCVALGVPCLRLPAAAVRELQSAIEKDPSLTVTLEVRAGTVALGGGSVPAALAKPLAAELPAGVRQSFLDGTWDALGLLTHAPEDIRRVARSLPYVRGFART